MTTIEINPGGGGGLPDPGSNGVVVRTAVDTVVARTITAGAGISVANGTGVAGNPTISASANGVTRAFGVTLDGAGSVLTTGWKGAVSLPYAGTITGWQLVSSDASSPVTGSIVIDVLYSTYADYPTMASIAGSEKPTLTSVQKNQDLTLSTWTTSVAAGALVGFNVESVSSLTRVNLVIFVNIT